MLTAIIVAAGSSRRMGFDKLLAPLCGKPLVAFALAAFDQTPAVTEIVVVAHADRLGEIEKIARATAPQKLRGVVAGGEHRQDSVRAGLNEVGAAAKYVAVHDAARPLTTPELIERVFAKAQEHGAAAVAEPVSDTLKRAGEGFVVQGSVDRQGVFAMQTPQIFRRDLIEEAYRAVAEKQMLVTDEVSAVELLGQAVVLVPNLDFNPKITFPRDFALAEFVLGQRSQK